MINVPPWIEEEMDQIRYQAIKDKAPTEEKAKKRADELLREFYGEKALGEASKEVEDTWAGNILLFKNSNIQAAVVYATVGGSTRARVYDKKTTHWIYSGTFNSELEAKIWANEQVAKLYGDSA